MTHDVAPGWGVLSDMDGTLLDTESTWLHVVERFVLDHGHDHGRDHALDHDGADAGRLAAASEGLDLDRAAVLLHERLSLAATPAEVAADLDRRALAAYAEAVAWRPGASELVRALADVGVPLGLVTSSPRHWVERFAESVDLSAFRIRVTADDTERTKPAPDPYLDGAAALGLPPDRCVVLEDSAVGAWSAVSAGCTTVVVGDPAWGVPPGAHRIGSLAEVDVPMLRALAGRTQSASAENTGLRKRRS